MIECVPNLSEGNGTHAVSWGVEALAEAGACVLDLHCDADHNRSVITAVGGESELEAGTLEMVRRTVQRIDLASHTGVHPRIGVVDVLPFVPLENASLAECIALARRVGTRVADELCIPVYLYEAAARNPARRNLAAIRRGGLPGLSERMTTPEGCPDLGPTKPHPTAGVIAIGARGFLVAFNVNLDATDVRVAKRIASAVRASSGGLAGVKALGLRLASRGITQVSMNLVEPLATTIMDAFVAVEQVAASVGCQVVESEIVGLVPQAALAGVDAERIRFPGRLDEITIEHRRAARCA